MYSIFVFLRDPFAEKSPIRGHNLAVNEGKMGYINKNEGGMA